jgi:hypothetical protein
LLNKNGNLARAWWLRSCVHRGSMSLELLIGRGLALCAHPLAAWRVLSAPGRAFVISAYAVGGYVTVLAALLLAR